MKTGKFIFTSSKNILVPFYIIFLFLCCGQKEKWHTSTLLYFDTLCEIKLHCSQEKFNLSLKEINDLFSHIEDLFSPDAPLSDFQEVFDLFKTARKIYIDSTGDFDISIAPLSKLWGFHDSNFRVPQHEEILACLKTIGLNKIKTDGKILSFPQGMSLDWGGIAKGYGVDQAVNICRENYISKGFINAGGDLFCWGNNPQGQLWKIGIKHPRKEGFLGILNLTDSGAATTGDYQRYFIEDNIRYHHVLDPKTGYPAEGNQSITVVGPETVICDALSTALFISSEPQEIVDKYPDYGAVVVDSNGRLLFLGKKINLTDLHAHIKQKDEVK